MTHLKAIPARRLKPRPPVAVHVETHSVWPRERTMPHQASPQDCQPRNMHVWVAFPDESIHPGEHPQYFLGIPKQAHRMVKRFHCRTRIATMNREHSNIPEEPIFLQLLFFHHAIRFHIKVCIGQSDGKSCIPPTSMRTIHNQWNWRSGRLIVYFPWLQMRFSFHATSMKCFSQ